MTLSNEAFLLEHLKRSQDTLAQAAKSQRLHESILQVSDVITNSLRNGCKILIAGNGGSAADAQHIAGEFLSRLNFDRRPLPAIALTTDSSVLTAVGNDYGYEKVFERQVLGLGKQGDVLIAISTSGRSLNILAALRAARELGVTTVGFSGSATAAMTPLCDYVVAVPSPETPMIQQIHIIIAHIICGIVERNIFESLAPAMA